MNNNTNKTNSHKDPFSCFCRPDFGLEDALEDDYDIGEPPISDDYYCNYSSDFEDNPDAYYTPLDDLFADKKSRKKYTYKNQTFYSIVDLCAILEIPLEKVQDRLDKGWSLEDAVEISMDISVTPCNDVHFLYQYNIEGLLAPDVKIMLRALKNNN